MQVTEGTQKSGFEKQILKCGEKKRNKKKSQKRCLHRMNGRSEQDVFGRLGLRSLVDNEQNSARRDVME